jgi:Glyoxalase-like domain
MKTSKKNSQRILIVISTFIFLQSCHTNSIKDKKNLTNLNEKKVHKILQTNEDSQPFIKGFDHIPVAVENLERSTDLFKKLGFTLKQGRFHSNGIRNRHIKFSNGTELELITAHDRNDALSTEYKNFISEGQGPAFVGLFTDDFEALNSQLQKNDIKYELEGKMVTFPLYSELHSLFFGTRSPSPTDKPEYFIHRNTAFSLIGTWIASENENKWITFLSGLNIRFEQRSSCFPLFKQYKSAILPQGEINFFPAEVQQIKNHPIVGVVIEVHEIEKMVELLKTEKINFTKNFNSKNYKSVLISPNTTSGFWLEFRQLHLAQESSPAAHLY